MAPWCTGIGEKKYDVVVCLHEERKKVKNCLSETESPSRRERLVVKWKDRMEEFMHKSGGPPQLHPL